MTMLMMLSMIMVYVMPLHVIGDSCQIELDTQFKQANGKLIVTGSRGTFDTTKFLGQGTFRRGYIGKVGQQDVVVKITKDNPHAKAQDWRRDVDDSLKAQGLADEFASKVWKLNKPFLFVTPKVFRVVSGCGRVWANDRVLVEPLLPGKWLKWSNNYGYVNTQAPGVNRGAVVQAFSHWTYHRSGGAEILVDIQGTHGAKGEQYTFTDPAFVTRKGRTSPADMGQAGIERYFNSYNTHWPCAKNQFCKPEWKNALKNPFKAVAGGARNKHTKTIKNFW
jgi:hypothetical protein